MKITFYNTEANWIKKKQAIQQSLPQYRILEHISFYISKIVEIEKNYNTYGAFAGLFWGKIYIYKWSSFRNVFVQISEIHY